MGEQNASHGLCPQNFYCRDKGAAWIRTEVTCAPDVTAEYWLRGDGDQTDVAAQWALSCCTQRVLLCSFPAGLRYKGRFPLPPFFWWTFGFFYPGFLVLYELKYKQCCWVTCSHKAKFIDSEMLDEVLPSILPFCWKCLVPRGGSVPAAWLRLHFPPPCSAWKPVKRHLPVSKWRIIL